MSTNERGVVTATTEVERTYYGHPVIRAPHWRFLIITYFFFGGIAGGSFIISALADLRMGPRSAIARVARYVSMGALLVSPPLLILDLGRPERFLNMLRILKLRSPMSVGSWALSGLGLFAFINAATQALDDLSGEDRFAGVRRTSGLLGLPFAAVMCGYTGVLLSVSNVPIWARNYLLLGPTFVASAFSTSFAAISLALGMSGKEDEATETALARAESICMAAELGLILAGFARLGNLGRPLRSGKLAAIFWPGMVVNGLVLPLLLQLTGPARGKGSPSRRMLAACMTLSGGYLLRALMIFAGRESAADPEYYFEYTKGRTRG